MRLIVKAVREERRVAGQRLAAAVITVGQRTFHPSARSSSSSSFFFFFLLLALYSLPSMCLLSTLFSAQTTGLAPPMAPAELIGLLGLNRKRPMRTLFTRSLSEVNLDISIFLHTKYYL